MKCFLVLATATILSVHLANAGVVQVGPGEENEALSLFNRICGGGGYSGGYGSGGGGGGEGGLDIGGALVYCKLASGILGDTLHHRVTASGSRGKDQIVFVRPAPVQYDHNIWVDGGNSQGGKTKIYVLPNQASHTVNTKVNGGTAQVQKPSVIYLGGSSSSSSPSFNSPPSLSYGTPPNVKYRAPVPHTPSLEYGTPPNLEYGVPQRLHKRSQNKVGLVEYPTFVSKY